MKHLQAEHAQWVERMYPGQTPDIPAAGMVEEAGELLHCAIALRRVEVWGCEARYPVEKLFESIVDAVGDCAIYQCSFCNAKRWTYEPWKFGPSDRRELLPLCIDIVRTAAEFSSCNYIDYFNLYTVQLYTVCEIVDIDFEETVLSTWEHVKARRRT